MFLVWGWNWGFFFPECTLPCCIWCLSWYVWSLAHTVEVLRIPRVDTLQTVHRIHCQAFELSVILLRVWELSLSHSPGILDWVGPLRAGHPVRSVTVVQKTVKTGCLVQLLGCIENGYRGLPSDLKLTNNFLKCGQLCSGWHFGSLKHLEDQTL